MAEKSLSLDELVLELRGRRRKVVAFWDDQAWVG